jgi:hypothetical protein
LRGAALLTWFTWPQVEAPWWIVKPSMTNGGAGLKVVDSAEGLAAAVGATADLQQWVVQRYIARPLLVDGRKFHLRVYVLCVGVLTLLSLCKSSHLSVPLGNRPPSDGARAGRLTVYVCKELLALFSLRQYAGASLADTTAHITNTCVQNPANLEEEKASVRLWSELTPAELGGPPAGAAGRVVEQVCKVTGELFEAVVSEMSFMALGNCFELFGPGPSPPGQLDAPLLI